MDAWIVWLIIGLVALAVLAVVWYIANKRKKTVNQDYYQNIEVCNTQFSGEKDVDARQKCISDAMKNQRYGRATAAAADATTTSNALLGVGEAGLAGWAFTR